MEIVKESMYHSHNISISAQEVTDSRAIAVPLVYWRLFHYVSFCL